MYVTHVSPKLRVPVLALALSTVLFILFLRSAYWGSSPYDSPRNSLQIPTAQVLPPNDEGLLFDHSPEPESESSKKKNKKKHAIVTAIWDPNYASMALMLGHSIRLHNDLDRMDAEMVILTLDAEDGWTPGLTAENRTILEEKGGWKIRTEPRLVVPGVNMSDVQPHRRLNLNKLQMFGWSEYERVIFVDADCFVKGSIEELLKLPEEVTFAAAPDGWPMVEVDPKFNSGFMFFTPSEALLRDMLIKLADKQYHDPKEGDQQFLQNYWKFRDYRLPSKFNLNLTHFAWRRAQLWDRIWPDARVVHFTDRKPRERWWYGGWCENPVTKPPNIDPTECAQIEVLKWYKKQFEQMRIGMGLEGVIGVLG